MVRYVCFYADLHTSTVLYSSLLCCTAPARLKRSEHQCISQEDYVMYVFLVVWVP